MFAERFRDTADPTTAFGANLLGAMLGGVLEYLSLITGYRGLLVLAAILYILAWVFGARKIGQPVGGRGRRSDRRARAGIHCIGPPGEPSPLPDGLVGRPSRR